jgi:hypothetical protein
MRVYLSGGMEYAADEGRSWREDLELWLERELGWQAFNPNRESDRFLAALTPDIPFRSLKTADPARYLAIVGDIVDIDCREVAERADCVICYWDDGAMRGAGTKGELTIARYFKKPVYLVTTIPFAEIPGWVLGCTTKMFNDFEELKAFLKEAA